MDRARCEKLSILLPKAMIIHGDATDSKLLEEEGIADMDAFVALTGFDEENLFHFPAYQKGFQSEKYC